MARPTQSIVLAAGAGTKIWPFGELRQKCTIPVANEPAVRRVVTGLQALGISRIAVVVGHFEAQVRHAVGDLPGVCFVRQSQPTGTADATLLGWAALDESDVLVAYGDTVVGSQDLASVADGLSDGVEAAALTAPLGTEQPNDWIVAHTDGERLREVVGHDRGGSHRLGGVFALTARARGYLERNPGIFRSVPVGGMPPAEADLGQSLQMMIDDGLPVRACEAREVLVDLDRPWHIEQANAQYLEHLASRGDGNTIGEGSRVSDGAAISGRMHLGRDCVIGDRVVVRGDLHLGDGSRVENGAIVDGHFSAGRNCRIRDYCAIGGGSAIGDHCVVAHGAELSGVLFDRVYLYHYCEMAGVYGSAVDIGAATVCGTLRFDDRTQVHHVKGRAEVPAWGGNGSYMGDYSRTGVNAMLMPGCKVGCYSCVGPGVIAYEDVPSRTVVLVKQELTTRPWGPEKYGW